MAIIKTDTERRKWQLTINNPTEHGFTHDWIKQVLSSFKSIEYWCMSDEIGKCGTYHTHIFMAFSSTVRFSSVKSKFNTAHIEACKGNSKQNRDYIFKMGKHAKDNDTAQNIEDTHEEWGEMPIEEPGARNDLADLADMIEKGMTNREIIKQCPQFIFRLTDMDKARQMFRTEKYLTENRIITTTYVYGDTGTGKTHDVMTQYKGDIFRVTDYNHPFDGYESQDVIMFDEFRSSLKISDMLFYLDKWPLMLPARNHQRVACYTKVFIVSNEPIETQYVGVQKELKLTWKSFLRRINYVKEYKRDKNMNVIKTEMPLVEAYWYTEDTVNLPI